MEDVHDRRQRERNPITGVGMTDKDSHDSIPNYQSYKSQAVPESDSIDTDREVTTDNKSLVNEELCLGSTTMEPDELGDEPFNTNVERSEPQSMLNLLRLEDIYSKPTKLNKQTTITKAGTPSLVRVPRQRQRDRNPITGDGMMDCDYRTTVPSFKIHGPQRKDGNPINFEGYAHDDSAYQNHVKEASISPLTRNEKSCRPTVVEKQQSESTQVSTDKPVSRQRQRERNPITGYGMEERDFRTQIPTFKIHGPQRRSGDPLTGTGYENRDKEYLRKVEKASDSPLNTPALTGKGASRKMDQGR